MMDEARLNRLEEMCVHVLEKELIIALREARRERDEWKGSYDRWMKDERTRLEERAARAETEVERLKNKHERTDKWIEGLCDKCLVHAVQRPKDHPGSCAVYDRT